MIHTQILEIEKRINEIYSICIDDVIASFYWVELENLILEKMKLERLLIVFPDRICSLFDLENKTEKFEIDFNLMVN